jgi:FlaA1/EpsC-like NDP-sugar epimerase
MSRRVLVLGAGEAGRLIVKELRDSSEYQREVIAFLDDDASLHGTRVEGIPVLGPTADVAAVARRERADEILISIPSAPGAVVRRLLVEAQRARIPVRIVPGIRDIIKGTVEFAQVREVSPEDLLGRQTVDLVEGPIRDAVAGKEVMVTGAGGSIGSELCRLLTTFQPSRLLLLGRGENSLFEIEEELQDAFGFRDTRIVLADVRDAGRLRLLARDLRPDVVVHAAAHKHVPLMELYPEEAVMVNVVGTANLLEFTRTVGASRFVMLSTDKAVLPRSVMGASKRVAEFLVQAAARHDGARYMAVRFGNVLGSRGSVVPLFQRQLQRGGPLTVTDRGATRYFMTIKEAAMLVLQAMAGGQGGEIFVLDMGEAINIHELAQNLIALAGFGESDGIAIVETGLRPGEKLQETYLADTEPTVPGPHPQILAARPVVPSGFDPAAVVEHLRDLAVAGDREGIRRDLESLIPDHEAHVDSS